ncbi:MAG: nucleoside triphosphate pyrophosphohydrolase [Spirochaetae bacterium HGW-Spirochaetae-3]|jgi:tetrapyrrole methylase family protein/MazG family protein|nr:MAG: nucleoside triphosphate pyrophosphohydrolase [Spirochaetae bacterium HGW-Spirochaetae-3]
MSTTNDPKEAFGRLYDIFVRLRSPEGCPWDREQTPVSIRGNLIEEAYECVEAINDGDIDHIKEEIGDVILVATMMAVIYEESGAFTTTEALDTISDKLVRRHPHVFADAEADTPDAVLRQWNDIKENVEGRRRKDSVLDAVSKALPPLERCYKLQKAAAKVGFDWPDQTGPWDKLEEELRESREACQAIEAKAASGDDDSAERAMLEDEIGDLFFSLVNVARKHRVDPAIAMQRAAEKFASRFRHVERRMAEAGEAMEQGKLEMMDRYWDEAKESAKRD